MMSPRFTPVADHALLVGFGDVINDQSHGMVLTLDHALRDAEIPGVIEVVPALVNLLIDFDPMITDHGAVQTAVVACLKTATTQQTSPNTHNVQVCYDTQIALDLAAVADAKGVSVDDVINAHMAGEFQVMMYGFSPGYAYMGGVPELIQVPRKPAAVRDVAAGSVIIAGSQCLITTLKMPTGWSIIGRTPTQVLTGDQDTPFLFDVGDQVRFSRITLDHYQREVGNGPS